MFDERVFIDETLAAVVALGAALPRVMVPHVAAMGLVIAVKKFNSDFHMN